MVIIISIFAFFATLLGGLFAIRFKDKLHLILGFSAGAVLGVAFFDLIPEALDLGQQFYGLRNMIAFVALGFLFFMLLDRFIILHAHYTMPGHDSHDHTVASPRGKLGAASLALHSFIDGAAIGLAFKVSLAVGIIVTTAVLVHDFSDGINTVNVILKNKGSRKEAMKWLFVDSLAPVLGAASTIFFTVPESALSIILAIFSGFFLYIGASDLLPESYHSHPTRWTTIATIIGAGVLFAAIRLAGI
ncbi:MAG: ZIP family metal transporter [Patescibacteria group bacterium]